MKYLTVNIKPVYDYRKKTTATSGSAKGGLACFDETFVVKQTFVLRMNICTKNRATSPSRIPLCTINHSR